MVNIECIDFSNYFDSNSTTVTTSSDKELTFTAPEGDSVAIITEIHFNDGSNDGAMKFKIDGVSELYTPAEWFYLIQSNSNVPFRMGVPLRMKSSLKFTFSLDASRASGSRTLDIILKGYLVSRDQMDQAVEFIIRNKL